MLKKKRNVVVVRYTVTLWDIDVGNVINTKKYKESYKKQSCFERSIQIVSFKAVIAIISHMKLHLKESHFARFKVTL